MTENAPGQHRSEQSEQHQSDQPQSDQPQSDQHAWNEKYAGSTRVWSGKPNIALTEQVGTLSPGRALDLGCGEGADAVWLAHQGWNVTAVDVSDVALERAAEHARYAGVADSIDWQRRDLATDFPPGEYDLVSVQFLYPRSEPGAREGILRRAAKAVAPGGILLIEGHSGFPAWEKHGHHDMDFPKPEEVLESLRLGEGDGQAEWDVLVCEEHDRVQNDPDGNPTRRTDSTLKVRRR